MKPLVDELMSSVPCYVIRYEDLLCDRVKVLSELFCFLLDVASIEGTTIEGRIRAISDTDFTESSLHKDEKDV